MDYLILIVIINITYIFNWYVNIVYKTIVILCIKLDKQVPVQSVTSVGK